MGGNITGFRSLGTGLVRTHFLVKDRRVGSHALGCAGNWRKDFVVDFDKGDGLFGDVIVDCGDSGDGMPDVKSFIPGEDIVALVTS